MVERFLSLKGEFEAEGLTRDEVAAEALYAARAGLDYLVKIGGCEAKSDVDFLERIGITSLVAPMIESAFAMEKYMAMLPDGKFQHVGVTIETGNAVDRIEEILDAGTSLTNATIGRSDLTASFGGSGVDSEATVEKVKKAARAAKRRGLEVTMGGGVSLKTVALLGEDPELAGLLDAVETRKVVIAVGQFLQPNVLQEAIAVELEMLALRTDPLAASLAGSEKRIAALRERV